jgi:hypothetical protein
MSLSVPLLIVLISLLGGILYFSGLSSYAFKDAESKIGVSSQMVTIITFIGLVVFVGLLVSKFV